MKNFFNLVLLSLIGLLLFSCEKKGKDDVKPTPPAGTDVEVVSKNISKNTTWTKGKVYELAGRISVLSGVTLTIEKGTVIKAREGSGTNATTLIIARGAKLMANGTKDEPIIMTSVSDKIKPGELVSPNLKPSTKGLWGGLIVLGKAPVSDKANKGEAQIEGIPASDSNGLYGGKVPTDNSGSLRYMSIRHTGADLGEGDEIQGLTLGGVGSSTVISYIEIVGSDDDGIEIFGGTVNPKNILVWDAKDDSFDMDQAYSGTVENFIAILGDNSDHALELDGPEGTLQGSFTLKNGSLKGNIKAGENGKGEYGDLRSHATCTLENLYFFGFHATSDLELDKKNNVAQNYLDGKIVFKNLEFNVSHLTSGNRTIAQIMKDTSPLNAFAKKPPTSCKVVTAPSAGVGADKSKFTTWTWADKAGQLSDFK